MLTYNVSQRRPSALSKRYFVVKQNNDVCNSSFSTVLGGEQADKIKTKKGYERVEGEVKRRINLLTKSEINDESPMREINMKAISVAGYPMHVFKFTKNKLRERREREKHVETTSKRQRLLYEEVPRRKKIKIILIHNKT